VKTTSSGAKTTPIVLYPRDTGDLKVTVEASGIVSTSFASGAITATAMATDAIGATGISLGAADKVLGAVSGTADSGTTTTLVDTERTEGDTDYWRGSLIRFTSGTLNGQTRLVTVFNPATDTITFTPPTSVAVGTHTYRLISAGPVDVWQWLNKDIPSPPTTGVPNVNVFQAAGTAWNSGAISAGTLAADAIGASEFNQAAADKIWASAARTLTDVTLAQLRTSLGVDGSDVLAELAQAIPSATPSLGAAIMLLYMALRNLHTSTATVESIANDAGTVIAKATLSDDGTTFTKAELVAGP
jgi:hypothetical protein